MNTYPPASPNTASLRVHRSSTRCRTESTAADGDRHAERRLFALGFGPSKGLIERDITT